VDLLKHLVDYILHVDVHLNELIVAYGTWTYAILFAIVFCETGFVVTPFLPGDSLLFAAGAFAAVGSLDSSWLFLLLSAAAIAGDTVNYGVGAFVGPKIFHKEHVRFLNREYLDRTHRFYEKHGGKTIVIARFMPIIRTFAPFVAGIGKMTYAKFLSFNVVGGMLWVGSFVYAGYYFGTMPAVKRNFTFVVAAIIVISTIPPIIEFLRHRARSNRKQ
jgi:membrane-associated protein